MTRLYVFHVDASEEVAARTDPAGIAAELAAWGVEYTRWAPSDADDVLEHYKAEVERVSAKYGYASVDVVRMTPDHPQAEAARGKFLSEHTHADDEARFFADGTGTFYLHFDDVVAALVCAAGDWVRVPAGTRHWFDMGTKPRFAAIRWFTTPEGWVATFTGSPIAKDFPTHDDLAGP